MVEIIESGMTFGPFQDDQVYQIEKADAYKKLGNGIKAVEFVYRSNEEKLFFVEAKSGGPKPQKEGFEKYIKDISDKFIHSFNLWMTLHLGRRSDDVSDVVIKADSKNQIFRFVLVLKGYNKEWLAPVKEALVKQMRPEVKIWNHEIIVLNDVQARDKGLVSKKGL